MSKAERTREQLEQDIADAEERAAAHCATIDALRAEVKELEAELARDRAGFEQLKLQRDQALEAVRIARTEVHSLSVDLNNAQIACYELRRQRDQAMESVRTARTKVHELAVDLNSEQVANAHIKRAWEQTKEAGREAQAEMRRTIAVQLRKRARHTSRELQVFLDDALTKIAEAIERGSVGIDIRAAGRDAEVFEGLADAKMDPEALANRRLFFNPAPPFEGGTKR